MEQHTVYTARTEQARPDIRGDRPSQLSLQQLVNQNRRFNLDVSPKLLYADGRLLRLLRRTGLGFYSDFQPLGGVLHLCPDGRLLPLPSSVGELREADGLLAADERRQLEELLRWCRRREAESAPSELDGRSLASLLAEWRIGGQLAVATFAEAFAHCPAEASAACGVARARRYLRSFASSSSSASASSSESPVSTPTTSSEPSGLAWIHYGCGEIAEVFCRHAAVWGATFALRRTATSLRISGGRVVSARLSSGETVRLSHCAMNARHAPSSWLDQSLIGRIVRAVFVTDAPLRASSLSSPTTTPPPPTPATSEPEASESAREHSRCGRVLTLSHKLRGFSSPATVLQLPSCTRACPPDTWIVHVSLPLTPAEAKSAPGADDPRELLQPLLSLLFAEDEEDGSRPHALLSAFFVVKDFTEAVRRRSPLLPTNVHLLPGPDCDIDPSSCVQLAERAFRRICPALPFLPPTPPAASLADSGRTAASSDT